MEKKTILLVEDNPDDIELALRAFKKSSFSEKIKITLAKDGKEAMKYLKLIQSECIVDKPEVILLDLNLPFKNGFEILEEIRKNKGLKQIPIIILTSSKEEKDIKKAYNLGVNSYIHKPVSFKEFKLLIEKIGDYWINVNESIFN